MIEPSDADLNSCPEVVQQYVKQLEAEASEKYYICPIMSRVVIGSNHGESMPDSSDLIEIKCLGKDCALWVVAGFTPEGETIEHCGLVK